MTATIPLIVGAGPSGLAAALFLHERGHRCRMVDAAVEPAPWSKALGVNPRTLDMLKPSGVTAAIIAEGLAVERVYVSKGGKPVAAIPLDYAAVGAGHSMTILPQARTEELLTEALARLGISVERAVRLTDITHDGGGVRAALTHADGRVEIAETSLLLGGDGAHSAVRKALGINFPGDAVRESWTLADLELDGPIPGAINIDFRPNGLLVAFPFTAERWRLVSIPGSIDPLPRGWSAGTVFWQSEFHVSHRLADRMSVGRVALAGDAAHIHSPVGARGMNLGIEDAWVWAACAADALAGRPERLGDYGRMRRKVDASVVRRIRRTTTMVQSHGVVASLLRRALPPLIARTPALRHVLLRQVAGLDHALCVS